MTEPALKPEEWAALKVDRSQYDTDGPMYTETIEIPLSTVVGSEGKRMGEVLVKNWADNGPPMRGGRVHRNRQALAALALHDQPFGFNESMVIAIRELVELATKQITSSQHALNESTGYASIAADRIEALLPPRGV